MAMSLPHPEPKQLPSSIDVRSSRSVFLGSLNADDLHSYSLVEIKFIGQISRVICKPAFALSNKIIFEGRALRKIVGEPCFVDYFKGLKFPSLGIKWLKSTFSENRSKGAQSDI